MVLCILSFLAAAREATDIGRPPENTAAFLCVYLSVAKTAPPQSFKEEPEI